MADFNDVVALCRTILAGDFGCKVEEAKKSRTAEELFGQQIVSDGYA